VIILIAAAANHSHRPGELAYEGTALLPMPSAQGCGVPTPPVLSAPPDLLVPSAALGTPRPGDGRGHGRPLPSRFAVFAGSSPGCSGSATRDGDRAGVFLGRVLARVGGRGCRVPGAGWEQAGAACAEPCAVPGARGSPRARCRRCPGSTACSPRCQGALVRCRAALLALSEPTEPCTLRAPNPGLLLRSPALARGPLPPTAPGQEVALGGPGAREGQAPGVGVGLAGGGRGGFCSGQCWPQHGSGAGTGGRLAGGGSRGHGALAGERGDEHGPSAHGASSHLCQLWAARPGCWSHGGRCDGRSMLARWRGSRAQGCEWSLSPGSGFSLCGGGCETPSDQNSTSRDPGLVPGIGLRWPGRSGTVVGVSRGSRGPQELPGCGVRWPRSVFWGGNGHSGPGPAPPPPSTSILIRLLPAAARAVPGVVCAACCCCAQRPPGCLALLAPRRPVLACLRPRGSRSAVTSVRRGRARRGCAQPAPLCSQEAG